MSEPEELLDQVLGLVQRLLVRDDREGAALAATLSILGDPNWQRSLQLVRELEALGDYELADNAIDVFERVWYTRQRPDAVSWGKYLRAGIRVKGFSPDEAARAVEAALKTTHLNATARGDLHLQLADHHATAGDAVAVGNRLRAFLEEGVTDSHMLARAIVMAEEYEVEDVIDALMEEVVPVVEAEPVATLSAYTLRAALPRGLKSYPKQFDHFLGRSVVAAESPIFVLEDVHLVFRERGTYIFDREGQLVTNASSHALAPALRAAFAEYEERRGDAPEVAGTAVLLQDLFILPHNYAHWLLDWMTRIALAEMTKVPFERVVGYELGPPFEHQTLAAAGFGEDSFVSTRDHPVTHFERLIVPRNTVQGAEHPAHLGHPDLVGWLKRLGKEVVGSRRRKRPTRVYVPRTGHRAVMNESDVVGTLEQAGFTVFDSAQHTFAEQVAMFSVAEAVVSPHGAGLANIVFAPESCHVLELFGPRGATPAYFVLASAIGQNYTPYLSTRDLPRLPFDLTDNSPIEVDLDVLEKWLGTLPPLARPSAKTKAPKKKPPAA
jgi:hypothetical protein